MEAAYKGGESITAVIARGFGKEICDKRISNWRYLRNVV
jgi:hypothetical protein